MLTRRFRSLSASPRVGAAVLAAVLVTGGGLALGTSTAAAAPHHPIVKADSAQLHGLVKAARDHTAKLRQARASHGVSSLAPADCVTRVPGSSVVAERFAGANRYDTAVCVSVGTWLDHTDTEPDDQSFVADAVVLARGDAFPDALAGGPFAAQVEGPLLLTSPTSLMANVKTEIQRVLAPGGKVYLLGGTGSLSAGVANAVTALGYQPVRIAGANRFDTAVKIADAMPDTSNFFITTGMNFPDALAAGDAAATFTIGAKYDENDETRPFALLFTQDTKMPAVTSDYANQRGSQFGVWALLTAGGSADKAAVSAFGVDNINSQNRFVGADRFQTATRIADGVFADESTGKLLGIGVGMVNGMNFPDALAGTVNLAVWTQPLLLTTPTSLNTTTRTFLRNHAGDIPAPAYLDVFGGTGVVTNSVMSSAQSALTPVA